MSAVSSTIKSTGIYALSNVIRYLASFVMLPIYTHYLTPADYGVLELLSTTVDLAAIILGMRIGEAIFRNYAGSETAQQKNTVITTSIALHVLTFGVGVLGLVLLAHPITVLVFGTNDYTQYVRLFAVIIFLQALSEVPMVFVRAQQRPWLYVSFSVLKLVLQVSFNVYFVVLQDLRIEGVIYGSLISSAIYSTVLLIYAARATGMARPDFSLARKLIGYSTPLMLADIGAFYLTFGDRYFLRIFSDFSELGIYALAYKFGFLLVYLVWAPFSNIWDIQKYLIHKQPDAKRVFQRTFLLISFVIIFAGLGMSLFIDNFLKIMSAPAFWSASRIVPVIVVAYILQMWTFYCSFGIYLRGNTIQITYGSVVASIVITMGYLLLIPPLGGMGAAVATLLAFLVRLVWVNVAASKHFDMELPWRKVASILGLAIIVYLVSKLWVPEYWLESFLWKAALCIVYIGLFMVLPIITERQKRALFAFIKNPTKLEDIIG